MEKTYIGIDNGTTGTIGILGNGLCFFDKTPTIKERDYTKEDHNITRLDTTTFYSTLSLIEGERLAVIERPMVNPGRFKQSLSAIRCHEATLVVLNLLEIPIMFIDSKRWQEYLLGGVTGERLKEASLSLGNEIFPNFKDVKHPDRDGLLITHYARLNNL